MHERERHHRLYRRRVRTAGTVDCNPIADDGREVFRNRNPTCAAPMQMGSIVRFVSATTCGASWHPTVTGATAVATTTCQ